MGLVLGQGGGMNIGARMRIVQMISHAGELIVLNDQGEMFVRAPDRKDFSPGGPKFVWSQIKAPEPSVESKVFPGVVPGFDHLPDTNPV